MPLNDKVSFGDDASTLQRRMPMIRTSQTHYCRECGSAHIIRNGRNRSGSQQYLCRGVRGQQGAAPQAAPQRGAQGRGAAGLSGAPLAARAEPHLRDLAQDDHYSTPIPSTLNIIQGESG